MPRQCRPPPRRAGFEGLRKDHCTPGVPHGPAHAPHGDHDDHPQSTVGDTGSPGTPGRHRGTRGYRGCPPSIAPRRDPPEQPGWGRQCRRRPSRHVHRRQPSGTGAPGGYLRPPARHGHSRGRTHPETTAPPSAASSTCPGGHQHPGGRGGVRGCPWHWGAPTAPPVSPHLGGRAEVAGRGRRQPDRSRRRGRGRRGGGAVPPSTPRRWGSPPGRRGLGAAVRHGDHQPPRAPRAPRFVEPPSHQDLAMSPPCPTRTRP